MGLKATGMARSKALIRKITPAVTDEFKKANRENAQAIVSTAKALVHSSSGKSRSSIKAVSDGDTGQIIDFGPLSKILEGGTKQRTNKSGANRGKGPKLPFKNPAMSATAKKRRARNRLALKLAIQRAKNG